MFSCKSIKKERITHIHCQSKETKEPPRNKGREEQCKKKKKKKEKGPRAIINKAGRHYKDASVGEK